MGKIRIKALGTEGEEAQKQQDKVRREEKKKRLTHAVGLKGGERVVDMSATAPEIPVQVTEEKEEKKLTATRQKKRISKKYLEVKKLVEPDRLYPIDEAFELVKKTSLTRFDGTVEVHLNTTEKGIRGQVKLPHGTGRQTKVAIANEDLISQIEKGKIDFDILVAAPSMMAKLARVAKILGPKGLMPNPKAGTISEKVEELAKKFSSGEIQFKTESEAPIIHQVLGKVSFSDKDLKENFSALVSAVGPLRIKSVTLCSTMGPGIKVELNPQS